MNWYVARVAFLVVIALGIIAAVPTEVMIAPSARLAWASMLLFDVPFVGLIVGAIAGLAAGVIPRGIRR
jgi:hypothetical protein